MSERPLAQWADGFLLIAGSYLEVGVLDPSILKTEHRLGQPGSTMVYRSGSSTQPRRRHLPRERVRSATQTGHLADNDEGFRWRQRSSVLRNCWPSNLPWMRPADYGIAPSMASGFGRP